MLPWQCPCVVRTALEQVRIVAGNGSACAGRPVSAVKRGGAYVGASSEHTTSRLLLTERLSRVEAGGAAGRNGGGRQAGRDDDEQTHGVRDRIEHPNDLANRGGARRGQQHRRQSRG